MGILTTDHLIQDDCPLFRMELIKSFVAPTPIFSASLHPSKSCFVAGGDDFKLYKFDYEDGKEIGENTELFKCLLTRNHFKNFVTIFQQENFVTIIIL